jgi:hypothetical protein
MGGALIQLVAYGIQDLYIVGDPQITFFKVVYRRHTNFSIESIIQHFSDVSDFGKKITCNLSHSGDLINDVFVYVELPPIPKFINKLSKEIDQFKKFAWVRNIGYALIKEMTIEINHKIIDRQFGEWLFIWNQLSGKHHKPGFDKMIGNVPELYSFSNGKNGYKLYVPLQFWFCRSIGLSLPIISLRNSDIKLTVTFRNLDECYSVGPTHSMEILEDIISFKNESYINQTISGDQSIDGLFMNHDYINKKINYIQIRNANNPKKSFTSLQDLTTDQEIINDVNYINNKPYRIHSDDFNNLSYCTPKPNTIETIEDVTLPQTVNLVKSYLYVDYIFLDNEERLKFSRSNHEYLVEQLQFNELRMIKSPNIKINLTLEHPCKSIYFVCQLDKIVGKSTVNDLFNYTTSFKRENNKLIGDNMVFDGSLQINGISRFGTRDSNFFNHIVPFQNHLNGPEEGINSYSMAFFPEKIQPTGSCNMSKIDFIDMTLTLNKVVNSQESAYLRVYTINYNVFRVFYGLGALAFK